MHRLVFLLTPLREGRPDRKVSVLLIPRFLLTPLREGRPTYSRQNGMAIPYFYSRPCGRGDKGINPDGKFFQSISTHAPAGGATETGAEYAEAVDVFLLTPLREGRHSSCRPRFARTTNISTHAPAGGATGGADHRPYERHISTHAPAGGATPACSCAQPDLPISTHAPAGGATAIFHKSVMRFCGKLPKDDTVLCLASFGFPRRDPKAVYLAWISCANLPQKCVRQGLALKDQGTSCFHEGLASHAFDPVLV